MLVGWVGWKGCGLKGVMVCEIGERFPNAVVVGCDLVPTELDYAPANCSFGASLLLAFIGFLSREGLTDRLSTL